MYRAVRALSQRRAACATGRHRKPIREPVAASPRSRRVAASARLGDAGRASAAAAPAHRSRARGCPTAPSRSISRTAACGIVAGLDRASSAFSASAGGSPRAAQRGRAAARRDRVTRLCRCQTHTSRNRERPPTAAYAGHRSHGRGSCCPPTACTRRCSVAGRRERSAHRVGIPRPHDRWLLNDHRLSPGGWCRDPSSVDRSPRTFCAERISPTTQEALGIPVYRGCILVALATLHGPRMRILHCSLAMQCGETAVIRGEREAPFAALRSAR